MRIESLVMFDGFSVKLKKKNKKQETQAAENENRKFSDVTAYGSQWN